MILGETSRETKNSKEIGKEDLEIEKRDSMSTMVDILGTILVNTLRINIDSLNEERTRTMTRNSYDD
jgi:hypothetical protein